MSWFQAQTGPGSPVLESDISADPRWQGWRLHRVAGTTGFGPDGNRWRIPVMGSSKRYRAYYAKPMDARIEEFVMREELIMLTAAELDLGNTPPVDFQEPRPVYAWIRYPFKAIRVQAHALAYTRTAVKIRFFEPLIMIRREAWVWRGAVTPAPPEEPRSGNR
ncbi:hypothetical protein D6T65_15185 [Arthrobacter frigidicola]|nr:hypothetical protein D6T65_15185 [Arthrobacter frigidicola]